MNGSNGAPHSQSIEKLLRDIHYQLIRLSRDQLIDQGMTPPRFHVLHHIIQFAPTDMGSMHAQMHVSRSSLTSLVDALVGTGLISRDRAADDRRRVVLRPTKAGIELLERLRQTRCALLGDALGQVDERSLSTLTEGLEQISRHLQSVRQDGGCHQ